MPVAIGADIGQKSDPTAIAVSESDWRYTFGRRECHYTTRFLERQPLQTPYPQIATRLHEVKRQVQMQARDYNVPLYVDATGVGAPVVDMMNAYHDDPIACFFTNGDKLVITEDGEIRIGKAWLVSRLQALLQARRIHVAADMPNPREIAAMLDELRNYEIRIDDKAKDTYGAFKTGKHDDIVTALGLSVFWEPADTETSNYAMGDVYAQLANASNSGRRFNIR